eukprot:273325_1
MLHKVFTGVLTRDIFCISSCMMLSPQPLSHPHSYAANTVNEPYHGWQIHPIIEEQSTPANIYRPSVDQSAFAFFGIDIRIRFLIFLIIYACVYFANTHNLIGMTPRIWFYALVSGWSG